MPLFSQLAWRSFYRAAVAPTAIFLLSSLVVVSSISLGFELKARQKGQSYLEAFSQFDGYYYREIAVDGYSYRPDSASTVAFFPLYPILGSTVAKVTGATALTSLLIVSNATLLVAFYLFAVYVHIRERSDGTRRQVGQDGYTQADAFAWSMLAFAFFPTCFFFHMTYSEPLFVTLCLLTMAGMTKRWPCLLLSAIVGAATAARPVGVALIPPLILHIWKRSVHEKPQALTLGLCGLLAFSGLLLYMAFLAYSFGDPFAFVSTQENWRNRPAVSFLEKILSLGAAEPIWSVYDPLSPAYWRRFSDHPLPLVNLSFLNPLFFAFAVACVILGKRKGWLTAEEILLSAGLLLIPYLTRAHEMCMASQARFAAVVFPVYIVLGHLLTQMPLWLSGGIIAIFAAFMFAFACMFAMGYSFY